MRDIADILKPLANPVLGNPKDHLLGFVDDHICVVFFLEGE